MNNTIQVMVNNDMFGKYSWILNHNYKEQVFRNYNFENSNYTYTRFKTPISFRVYPNAAQSLPDNTWTRILFNAANWDESETGGANFDYTTSEFVIPAGYDGVYNFFSATRVNGMVNGSGHCAGIFLNGSYVRWGEYDFQGNTDLITTMAHASLNLVAGDRVASHVWQLSGASRSIGITTDTTFFAGWRER